MSDNADQAAFWSGDAGQRWVTYQDMLDQQMLPVLEQVLQRAGLQAGQQVLDVGCGTGQSSLMAAEAVGLQGHVLGADISPVMVAQARKRAAGLSQVKFSEVDVAHHRFEPKQFDNVLSRFGVMFFADPVAAFTNIAYAMKPGAQITFAAWGQIPANPWFTLPARVAKEMLGAPPKSDPDAPGPFAFRDIDHVTAMLRSAGFSDVSGHAEPVRFTLPNGARDFSALTTRIGPAAGTLAYFEADEAARAALEAELYQAFSALPDQAVPGEINYFTAHLP